MAKNLWKLDRSAKQESVETGETSSQAAEGGLQTVGATLRSRREERGEDLRYVSQVLRIRFPYLKALEDGLIDDLPGPTYAVGFVRTYADHLDLNVEALVARFKEEVKDLNSRTDLHFPAPLPEGKIPSGAILLVAVLLAGLVYGAWIYLSSKDQQVAEIVPQLPSRISEIIKGKPSDVVNAAPSETVTSSAVDAKPDTPAKPADAPPPQVSKKPTDVSAPKPEATQPAEPQSTPAVAAVPPPATPAEPVAEPADQSPADAAPPAPPAPPSSDASAVPAAPVSAGPGQQIAALPTPTSEDTQTVESADALAGGKIYGNENADARIIVQALSDSWVEIRDSESAELLLTRVLFKGDSYQVPNRSGLTLLTGNAGGLRITVDGSPVPTIGPPGAVRRDVALEPEPLKSGKAVGAAPPIGGTSE
jgi:cytoskeleton protein RodZ